MSSFTTGGSSDLDKLIALATFLSSPEYLERAKSLRDIIDESEKRVAEAKDAVTEAAEAVKAAQQVAERHAEEKKAFEAERAQHRADMDLRESQIEKSLKRITEREIKVAALETDHQRDNASWMSAKTKMERELVARESTVKISESNLEKAKIAHNKRVAALNRAMTDED